MKKEKYKNFPLIKTFAAKEGNTYLYDGRANIFLCLSPKESDTISRYLSLNESSEEEAHVNLSSMIRISSKNYSEITCWFPAYLTQGSTRKKII